MADPENPKQGQSTPNAPRVAGARSPAPASTDALTTLLAAGVQSAYAAQQTLFGGQMPAAANLVLDLARAHLSFHYKLLRVGLDALDQAAAARVAQRQAAQRKDAQPQPAEPQPAKQGGLVKTVVVIGGGVAGLTAAHELVERGFDVHLVEREANVGGKAASERATCAVNPAYLPGPPHLAVPADLTLPAEHGFRFFPSFYTHVTDTMRRTPVWDRNAPPASPRADQRFASVADNLIPCLVEAIGFADGKDIVTVLRSAPRSIQAVLQLLRAALRRADFTLRDVAQYQLKIFELMTSCDERRESEYEAISWWDFVHSSSGVGWTDPPITFSPAFDKYLDTTPQLLVAMDAHQGAARAQGEVLVQMLLDQASIGGDTDRVLNGPSSDQWITPWRGHLERLGVHFYQGELDHFDLVAGAPEPAWTAAPAGLPAAPADYYVLAISMPDAYAALYGGSGGVVGADPTLLPFQSLSPATSTAWINGVQFYLRDDVEILRGHTALADSPWCLSMVSQAQFWGDDFINRHGAGNVGTILSVDVARWDVPGISAPAASQCTEVQLVSEVWRQIRAGVRTDRLTQLPDWPPFVVTPPSLIVAYNVDDDIHFSAGPPPPVTNEAPMFINGPGSWDSRPGPLDPGYDVHLGKLVIAGDYTQTFTGLPCMEGANESARHAVNAILDAESASPGGRPYERCAVWPLSLREPGDITFLKELDRKLFLQGVPNIVHTLGWQKLMLAVPDDIPSTAPAIDLLAGLITGLYPFLQLV